MRPAAGVKRVQQRSDHCTDHTHSPLHSVYSQSHFSFFFIFHLALVLTHSLSSALALLLTHTASTTTHIYTNTSGGGHCTACSVVSSSLVKPGSLIKAPNEAACIKHEAPRAAVMNCCSIIASQSRKMKTKYLKRDSVTSLQTQH